MRKKLVQQAGANGGDAQFLGRVEDLPTAPRTNKVSSIVHIPGSADVDLAGVVDGVDVSSNWWTT